VVITLEKLETFLGNFLRYGVLVCGFVIAVGLGMSLAGLGHGPSTQETVAGLLAGKVGVAQPPLHCFAASPWADCLGQPESIIALGILLLISLPILRVLLTLAVFIVQGDRVYASITGIVLAVLLFGLFFGAGAHG